MKFKVNDIVVTSGVENLYFYNVDYLVLQIKGIKKNIWGEYYYKCKVLNDNSFYPGFNYAFYESEVQTPSEMQLIEISQKYWEELYNVNPIIS